MTGVRDLTLSPNRFEVDKCYCFVEHLVSCNLPFFLLKAFPTSTLLI
jgi:hypothetical protein